MSNPPECQFHANCGGYCETDEEIELCLCEHCLQSERDEEARIESMSKEIESLRAQLKKTEAERDHFRECMYQVGAEAAKLKTECDRLNNEANARLGVAAELAQMPSETCPECSQKGQKS